jgi:hypothetical protein
MKKITAGLAVCAALVALGLSACDAVLPVSDEGGGPFSDTKGILTFNNLSLGENYRVYISSDPSITSPWPTTPAMWHAPPDPLNRPLSCIPAPVPILYGPVGDRTTFIL